MRLCRCLNYEKLTLEACKDLAKNRRIPPGIAVQALASQQSKLQIRTNVADRHGTDQMLRRVKCAVPVEHKRASPKLLDEKEELKFNLQRMQNRVMELEKVCREMKGQMSKMVNNKSYHNARGLSRLC